MNEKKQAEPVAWEMTEGGAYTFGPYSVVKRVDGKGWNALTLDRQILLASSLEDCKVACAYDYTHPAPAVAVNDDLAKAIHYPQCWDVAVYPTLAYAISELATCFQCCECVKSPAVAVNEQLLRAAKKYFVNYCLDEASEFFAEDTGCSQEQHDDAVELREAIVAAEAAKGGV